MSDSDPSFWRDVTGWLWAILVPMGIAMWTMLGGRIKRVEEDVAIKADNDELNRARDTQKDIFSALREHDIEDRKRFEALQIGMGRIEGKVDGLLNRARTRSGDIDA